jgi:hypothetical protein
VVEDGLEEVTEMVSHELPDDCQRQLPVAIVDVTARNADQRAEKRRACGRLVNNVIFLVMLMVNRLCICVGFCCLIMHLHERIAQEKLGSTCGNIDDEVAIRQHFELIGWPALHSAPGHGPRNHFVHYLNQRFASKKITFLTTIARFTISTDLLLSIFRWCQFAFWADLEQDKPVFAVCVKVVDIDALGVDGVDPHSERTLQTGRA